MGPPTVILMPAVTFQDVGAQFVLILFVLVRASTVFGPRAIGIVALGLPLGLCFLALTDGYHLNCLVG